MGLHGKPYLSYHSVSTSTTESETMLNSEPRRILRAPEVERLTGLTKSSRLRLQRAGKFPQPVRLSQSAIGFYADEVEQWIATRPRVEVAQ
jgi:prophage regulatory protein